MSESKYGLALFVGGNFHNHQMRVRTADGYPVLSSVDIPKPIDGVQLSPKKSDKLTKDDIKYESYRFVARVGLGSFLYVAERAFEKGW